MAIKAELEKLAARMKEKADEYDRKAEKSRKKEDWARYGGTGTGFSTAELMLRQFIANFDFSQTED